MDAAQKLIQAIATLLWPIITVFILYILRPAIIAVLESARSRKFTLKVGGQELTMEEANQVQQNLIADLQKKVSGIEKGTPAMANQSEAATFQSQEPDAERVSAILWVDDNPKNNSYFIQRLSERGVRVDLANSTSAGISRFSSKRYDYVISDMGRQEGLIYAPSAGIDLLKHIRKENPRIPFLIYCSAQAVESYGEQALALGATAITSSPTELFGLLDNALTHAVKVGN